MQLNLNIFFIYTYQILMYCYHKYIYIFNQGRTPGEAFVPKSVKEAEMEKLMKSMEVYPISEKAEVFFPF